MLIPKEDMLSLEDLATYFHDSGEDSGRWGSPLFSSEFRGQAGGQLHVCYYVYGPGVAALGCTTVGRSSNYKHLLQL